MSTEAIIDGVKCRYKRYRLEIPAAAAVGDILFDKGFFVEMIAIYLDVADTLAVDYSHDSAWITGSVSPIAYTVASAQNLIIPGPAPTPATDYNYQGGRWFAGPGSMIRTTPAFLAASNAVVTITGWEPIE